MSQTNVPTKRSLLMAGVSLDLISLAQKTSSQLKTKIVSTTEKKETTKTASLQPAA